MPAPPPGAPAAPQLWRPGALEELAAAAGLSPVTAFDFSYAMEYPDAQTLGRLMVAPAGIAALVGPEREQAVRAQIVEALAAHRTSDGTYGCATSSTTSSRPAPEAARATGGPRASVEVAAEVQPVVDRKPVGVRARGAERVERAAQVVAGERQRLRVV